MPQNKNNIDDLNYLSELGFEKMPISEADIKDLKIKIKNRTFSYNNGFYFGFICLITGVFIGITLFFAMGNSSVSSTSKNTNVILTDSLKIKPTIAENLIKLDTINVVNENFIKPVTLLKNASSVNNILSSSDVDTNAVTPIKAINVSPVIDNVNESKLKYIINSSIIYIHDLKVSDYTTLYFKKNQYVKFISKDGVPGSYANRNDYDKNNSNLKQTSDYFLHEELSKALLLFKKAEYDKCIYSLNVISSYNHSDLNCDFYLGMCYYYKKNFVKAMECFDKCIQNPNNAFLQEASYYNALAIYENGDKETALKKFKFIADEAEFYAEKAKSFLKN